MEVANVSPPENWPDSHLYDWFSVGFKIRIILWRLLTHERGLAASCIRISVFWDTTDFADLAYMSDIHNHTSFEGTSTGRQQGADIRWIKRAIVEVGMCVVAACLSLYRIILSLKIIPWTRKAYESLLVNRESCVGKSLQKERQSSKLGTQGEGSAYRETSCCRYWRLGWYRSNGHNSRQNSACEDKCHRGDLLIAPP